jgi:hypothetical protein
MPIKTENKKRYSADWFIIRERIRERAKDRCEGCGVHNHSVGYRDSERNFVPCSGNVTMEDYGQGIDPNTSKLLDYKDAKSMADFQTHNDEYGFKYLVIVCTVAHLDHTPENCSDENLKFLCQRCHNLYDIPHRKETRHNARMKDQLEMKFGFFNDDPFLIKITYPNGDMIKITKY